WYPTDSPLPRNIVFATRRRSKRAPPRVGNGGPPTPPPPENAVPRRAATCSFPEPSGHTSMPPPSPCVPLLVLRLHKTSLPVAAAQPLPRYLRCSDSTTAEETTLPLQLHVRA